MSSRPWARTLVQMLLGAFVLPIAWLAGCNAGIGGGGGRGGNTNDNGGGFDKLSLWTEGTRLRGANIYQRRVYPELDGTDFLGPGPAGPPLTQQDFDGLADFGANYVNLSHPGIYTENPPYELDVEMQDNLDRLLEMAEQADLFVVITFRTGPGRSEFDIFWGEDTTTDPQGGWFDASYYNNTVWTSEDTQDAFAAMWRYAADRYKNNPVVAGYDLLCEPNSPAVFFDAFEPGEFYPAQAGTLYDWNQFYPDIVSAIREVDAGTPILVQPMGWGAPAWLADLEPTEDTRTVYLVHQYEPFVYTHQPPDAPTITYPGSADLDGDGAAETFDRSWLDALLADTVDPFRQEHDVRLAINEFGPQRFEPGAGQYVDELLDLIEQRGMNHAIWEWSASWPPMQQENDHFNFLHGPEPDNHTNLATSDFIEAVRKYWARNAVRPSNATSPGLETRALGTAVQPHGSQPSP